MKRIFAIFAVILVLGVSVFSVFAEQPYVSDFDKLTFTQGIYLNTGDGSYYQVPTPSSFDIGGVSYRVYLYNLYSYCFELSVLDSVSGTTYTLPVYFRIGTTIGVTLWGSSSQSKYITASGYIPMTQIIGLPNTSWITIDLAKGELVDAYDQGKDIGSSESYELGKSVGRAEGEQNLQDRLVIATEQGRTAGYAQGYAQGKEDYENASYQDGYQDGLAESGNLAALPIATVNGIAQTFRDIFSFEILGINIAGLIGGIITLILLFVILKKVL